MVSIRLEVPVPAPVERTWDAATDWDRQGEWMLGTRVRATSQDGRGVGGAIEAFTGVGPLGFLDSMQITEWEPPVRCAVVHTGRVVQGTGVFEVRPHPGGSVFVWAEELELPWGLVGRLGWPLVRPLFLLGVRRSLARFAHWVPRR